MQRGTRVGQAYVALAVDGSNVNDDIIDAFDDVDYEDLGKQQGKKMGEARAEEIRKHNEMVEADFKGALKRIDRAISANRAIEDNVSRNVAKAFKKGKLDSVAAEAARRAGVKMGDGFDKEINAAILRSVEKATLKASERGETNLKKMFRNLGEGDGQFDILGPGFLDDAVRDIEKVVKARADADSRIAKARKKTEEDYEKFWLRALKDREIAESKSAERAAAARKKIEEDYEKFWIKALDSRTEKEQKARKKIEDDYEKFWIKALDNREKEAVRSAERAARAQKKIEEAAERARLRALKEAEREEQRSISRRDMVWRATVRARAAYERDLARDAAKAEREQARRQRILDMTGDRWGRRFGKGSRNNLLNLFGGLTGGVIGMIAKAGRGVSSLFRTFSVGFNSLEQGAGILSRLGAGFSQIGTKVGPMVARGLMSLAASAPLAAVAIATLVAIMSVLVSVASALLGIVVALASTIASALVAAVAVAVPLFAGLAATVGLVTAAFTSMTDAQKESLKQNFSPLKNELKGLGRLVLRDLEPAFATWANNLKVAINEISPLAAAMGSALGRAGSILTRSLSGEGVKQFLASLTTFLPTITVNMTRALGNFINGVSSMFAALMPYVERFSIYLNNVAARFAKWAASGKGQNSIKDFMDRAVESTKSLWGFLKQVGGLLSDLLFNPKGQDAGNSMFDGMTDAIKRFRKYIEDGGLERWFDRAKDFAKKLGRALEDLGKVIDALDSSDSLEAFGDALGFFTGALEKAATFSKRFKKVTGVDLFSGLTQLSPVKQAADALVGLWNAGKDLIGMIKDLNLSEIRLPAVKLPPGLDFLLHKIGVLKNEIRTIPSISGIVSGIQNNVNAAIAAAQQAAANAMSNRNRSGGKPQPLSRGNVGRRVGQMVNTSRLAPKGKSKDDILNQTSWTPEDLIALGTDPSSGGKDKDKDKGKGKDGSNNGASGKAKQWKNPWKQWALKLIYEGPSVAKQIANALKWMSNLVNREITKAANQTTLEGAVSILSGLESNLKDKAKEMKSIARDELNAAAQNLANASNGMEALYAHRAVKKAQANLQTAKKLQKRVAAATKLINAQKVVTGSNVNALVNGLLAENATLADYAAARERVAVKIEESEAALAAALELRDSYYKEVKEGVIEFGSLLSAQAKTVNGIEQALTASDITENLQSRLNKIRTFQSNLRALLALGVSDAVYKQLVDAGVEQGSAYADALLQGGSGAIETANGLLAEIEKAGDELGFSASDRLYQSGVDVARGILDGWKAREKDLNAAADALGKRVAQAIQNALYGVANAPGGSGTNAPGTGVSGSAGTGGASNGGRPGSGVPTPPPVTPPPGWGGLNVKGGPQPVSGNSTFRDLVVVTPSKDPVTVAHEVLNEVTGRLL